MRAMLGRLLESIAPRPDRMSDELRFALNEIGELRQLVRMLLAESPAYRAWREQTTDSFDTQWDKLPTGVQLLGNPEFDGQSVRLVEAYTGLQPDWFRGKQVLDAGCGNGRWSYTLAKLGAVVTALDRSAAGLKEVERVCNGMPGFRALRHDLLEPLPTGAAYDFVWNFGVVHHTGWTERALRNVCGGVRPGGILFTMIYGEPREGRSGEFAEINTYTELRRATSGLSFDERIAYLRKRFKEEDVNAWFDGISPKVNDLHRFDEIRSWLLDWGFEDVRRTFENRNLFITARRRP